MNSSKHKNKKNTNHLPEINHNSLLPQQKNTFNNKNVVCVANSNTLHKNNKKLQSNVNVRYCVNSEEFNCYPETNGSQPSSIKIKYLRSNNKNNCEKKTIMFSKQNYFESSTIPLRENCLESTVQQSHCPMVVNVHKGCKIESSNKSNSEGKTKEPISPLTNYVKTPNNLEEIRDVHQRPGKENGQNSKSNSFNDKNGGRLNNEVNLIKIENIKRDVHNFNIDENNIQSSLRNSIRHFSKTDNRLEGNPKKKLATDKAILLIKKEPHYVKLSRDNKFNVSLSKTELTGSIRKNTNSDENHSKIDHQKLKRNLSFISFITDQLPICDSHKSKKKETSDIIEGENNDIEEIDKRGQGYKVMSQQKEKCAMPYANQANTKHNSNIINAALSSKGMMTYHAEVSIPFENVILKEDIKTHETSRGFDDDFLEDSEYIYLIPETNSEQKEDQSKIKSSPVLNCHSKIFYEENIKNKHYANNDEDSKASNMVTITTSHNQFSEIAHYIIRRVSNQTELPENLYSFKRNERLSNEELNNNIANHKNSVQQMGSNFINVERKNLNKTTEGIFQLDWKMKSSKFEKLKKVQPKKVENLTCRLNPQSRQNPASITHLKSDLMFKSGSKDFNQQSHLKLPIQRVMLYFDEDINNKTTYLNRTFSPESQRIMNKETTLGKEVCTLKNKLCSDYENAHFKDEKCFLDKTENKPSKFLNVKDNGAIKNQMHLCHKTLKNFRRKKERNFCENSKITYIKEREIKNVSELYCATGQDNHTNINYKTRSHKLNQSKKKQPYDFTKDDRKLQTISQLKNTDKNLNLNEFIQSNDSAHSSCEHNMAKKNIISELSKYSIDLNNKYVDLFSNLNQADILKQSYVYYPVDKVNPYACKMHSLDHSDNKIRLLKKKSVTHSNAAVQTDSDPEILIDASESLVSNNSFLEHDNRPQVSLQHTIHSRKVKQMVTKTENPMNEIEHLEQNNYFKNVTNTISESKFHTNLITMTFNPKIKYISKSDRYDYVKNTSNIEKAKDFKIATDKSFNKIELIHSFENQCNNKKDVKIEHYNFPGINSLYEPDSIFCKKYIKVKGIENRNINVPSNGSQFKVINNNLQIEQKHSFANNLGSEKNNYPTHYSNRRSHIIGQFVQNESLNSRSENKPVFEEKYFSEPGPQNKKICILQNINEKSAEYLGPKERSEFKERFVLKEIFPKLFRNTSLLSNKGQNTCSNQLLFKRFSVENPIFSHEQKHFTTQQINCSLTTDDNGQCVNLVYPNSLSREHTVKSQCVSEQSKISDGEHHNCLNNQSENNQPFVLVLTQSFLKDRSKYSLKKRLENEATERVQKFNEKSFQSENSSFKNRANYSIFILEHEELFLSEKQYSTTTIQTDKIIEEGKLLHLDKFMNGSEITYITSKNESNIENTPQTLKHINKSVDQIELPGLKSFSCIIFNLSVRNEGENYYSPDQLIQLINITPFRTSLLLMPGNENISEVHVKNDGLHRKFSKKLNKYTQIDNTDLLKTHDETILQLGPLNSQTSKEMIKNVKEKNTNKRNTIKCEPNCRRGEVTTKQKFNNYIKFIKSLMSNKSSQRKETFRTVNEYNKKHNFCENHLKGKTNSICTVEPEHNISEKDKICKEIELQNKTGVYYDNKKSNRMKSRFKKLNKLFSRNYIMHLLFNNLSNGFRM